MIGGFIGVGATTSVVVFAYILRALVVSKHVDSPSLPEVPTVVKSWTTITDDPFFGAILPMFGEAGGIEPN